MKCKNNLGLTLVSFFILYSTYSIVIGEYLVAGKLSVPMVEVKNTLNYGVLIKGNLIFILILSLYTKRFPKNQKIHLNLKNNSLIYGITMTALIYILIFGINRVKLTTYVVSTKPMYEYAYLLILISYYYSGKSLIKKVMIVLLTILLMLQDFYYGGRVTSIQLSFMLILTVFINYFTYFRVLLLGIFGVIFNSLVAEYRAEYSIENINITEILNNFKNNLFVFDTPVFAYYASGTHVAAAHLINFSTRIKSFFVFIASNFTGSNYEIANVTQFVDHYYFDNLGGGLIFSHFYFWLGWFGIILIAFLISQMFNILSTSHKNEYKTVLFIILICTVPRWYLYTPLLLFRPLVMITIIFFLFKYMNRVMENSPINIKKGAIYNE